MKTITNLIAIALLPSAFARGGADSAAFDRMQSLSGRWVQGAGSQKSTVTYRLTGGGSALVETLFQGTAHEMVTVYHLDKGKLVMTHYCAMHNQPTMRLVSGIDPSTLHFVFISGSNMDPSDAHMHEPTLKFLGKNHITEAWRAYSAGKPGELINLDFHRAG